MKSDEARESNGSDPGTKSNSCTVITPGATIGVLGGGQLGRMLGLEARRMGYGVHVFDPDAGCPAGRIADAEVNAPYSDRDALARFAKNVDIVTYEFENIPVDAIREVARFTRVAPRGEVLHICQNREREKLFLHESGLACAPFRIVTSADETADALAALGGEGVLKTADFGYDGKGQRRIRSGEDPRAAWHDLGVDRAVLEAWVRFEKEISVVVARGWDGTVSAFPVSENLHTHHILDLSIVPARIPESSARQATELAVRAAERLDVVGVMAVEFFLLADGSVIVNEIAPRPHNSGHFSFDACVTSQFEQQLRAVCGLPLGGVDLLSPVAMKNLLGDRWEHGEPDWAAALADPEIKLHLYGKSTARPGRKMGHLCAMADSVDEAVERVEAAAARLTPAR